MRDGSRRRLACACVAPDSQRDWYPASAPCDPCDKDGATRVCEIDLGLQGQVRTCFKGTETCTGGYWGNCL